MLHRNSAKKQYKEINDMSLIKQKRFAPYFLTQFLGAFNDNVFKNALVILLTFKIVWPDKLQTSAKKAL